MWYLLNNISLWVCTGGVERTICLHRGTKHRPYKEVSEECVDGMESTYSFHGLQAL